jgi:hypothetical protein
MDGPRPNRHLTSAELTWFDLDPAWLVELAAKNEDRVPGLAHRLATCRHAAWRCDSYLVLREVQPTPGMDTVLLDDGDAAEFAIDLDRSGDPVGIEFLHWLPCRSDDDSDITLGAVGAMLRGVIGRLHSR